MIGKDYLHRASLRLALCNEVVRELPFPEQCRLARTLGYQGLEVAPFTLGAEPHRLSASARAELRTVANDEGVEISGLHWLLVTPAGLSITTPDDDLRARTADVMLRLIDLCQDLGGSYLVHGSPKQRQLPDGPEAAEAAARSAECFEAAATQAQAAGLTYCLEPLAPAETNYLNTVAEAAQVVEAIGSPALKTMLDTSAAAAGESEPAARVLERWLPSGVIGHVHLNDRNRRAPGQGNDRFAPILATLLRYGYTGWCGVEPFQYEPDGPTTAAQAIGYLHGVLDGLAGDS